MTTYYAHGSPTTVIGDDQLRQAITEVLRRLGVKRRVLVIPPDMTRFNSRAGRITDLVTGHYGAAVSDVLPALGTHKPMSDHQVARMFPATPRHLFRVHDWRHDVVTVGTVDAAFVKAATGGIWDRPWPCQLNRLIAEGGHDLIVSPGQVVPHEVTGMANYTKNLFVGCGGSQGINESHFIGAAYGMERMMGRADTPVRRILNEGYDRFCRHLPCLFILTVVGPDGSGGLALRGLFIGDHHDTFEQAAALSLQVNFTMLDEEPRKVVCFLDPEEFDSTWLGNKSVYRTRMAIATAGQLVVLAPAVKTFGEDPEIDRLIRKYGYRPSATILRLVREHPELAANLSAAAHLIHGSSEDRFTITYCPGHLTRNEIESVGYQWGDLAEHRRRYDPDILRDGWNTVDGERIYYISNPALGLWAWRGRFT